MTIATVQPRPTTIINGGRIDLRPGINPSSVLQEQPPKVCRPRHHHHPTDRRQQVPAVLAVWQPRAQPPLLHLLRETQEGLHGSAKDETKEEFGGATRRRVRGLAGNSTVALSLLAAGGIRKVASFLDHMIPDEHGVLYDPRRPRDTSTGPPGTEPAVDI